MVRWTEEQLSKKIKKKTPKKKAKKEPNSLKQSLSSLGLGEKTQEPKKKLKRKGTSTGPIFKTLIDADPEIGYGNDWFALNIDGGRILTYNQLYSILQFRKFEAFRYKKVCRAVITKAVDKVRNNKDVPFFDGPCRLTLVRVGTKEMDRDALPVVFKYFLDSLKTEGIINDDNPNIIVDIVTYQSKGKPRLSMRLDKLPHWEAQKIPLWEDWVRN